MLHYNTTTIIRWARGFARVWLARLPNPSHLPHANCRLDANATEQGKIGQHLHGGQPVAVTAERGVGGAADAANQRRAAFLRYDLAFQSVVAQRDQLFAKAAHLGKTLEGKLAAALEDVQTAMAKVAADGS